MNPSLQALSLWRVLACGAVIVTLSMGVRHGFGLWLQPITEAQGWTRQDFAFAIALQNLTWGVVGIFSGMIADRLGAFKVILTGTVLYALGILGMAFAESTLSFALLAGVLIGFAQAGTTYAVVYGVIGRNVPEAKRSWAMGLTASAASFGQFLMVPVEGWLILNFGWQEALVWVALIMLVAIPFGYLLKEPQMASGVVKRDQTILEAVREAFSYSSFQMLMAGYFVCGFQVVFIGVHMPSFLKDEGLGAEVASLALALIGLFNVIGTYIAGVAGQKYPKRKILAMIYIGRSIAIVLFLSVPMSPASVYVFSAVMGLLWLSTVPVTSATVAQIFGVAHLSMLGGFVFLSHQVGSFLGVWLGGVLYDQTGSYTLVWCIAIGLGLFAAAINLPINEKPIVRSQRQLQV